MLLLFPKSLFNLSRKAFWVEFRGRLWYYDISIIMLLLTIMFDTVDLGGYGIEYCYSGNY